MNVKFSDKRVLIITDDLNYNQIWAYALSQDSRFAAVSARSLDEALELWSREAFDVIILNFYGSTGEAINVCRQLRPEVTNPILLLQPNSSESLQLEAYAAGADECIPKPIGHRLFQAKVKAWCRRSWTVPAESLDLIEVDNLRLNPTDRHLTLENGSIVKLSNLEFRVLYLLMSHRGQVLETNTIVDRVWGHSGNGDSVLLKNVIYRLRRKIEDDPGQPRFLQTIASGGYTFLTSP